MKYYSNCTRLTKPTQVNIEDIDSNYRFLGYCHLKLVLGEVEDKYYCLFIPRMAASEGKGVFLGSLPCGNSTHSFYQYAFVLSGQSIRFLC